MTVTSKQRQKKGKQQEEHTYTHKKREMNKNNGGLAKYGLNFSLKEEGRKKDV